MGVFIGFGETRVIGELEISCTSNRELKNKYPVLYGRRVPVKCPMKLKYYLGTYALMGQ
jgi:hypothetical protein